MKRIILYFLLTASFAANAQRLDSLTVEKIMRDPKWMGVSPSNIQWGEDSHTIYFNWNPEAAKDDALYQVSVGRRQPQKVSDDFKRSLDRGQLNYSKDRSKVLFERKGDLVIRNVKTGQENILTSTIERESNPGFSKDESSVIFQRGDNLYKIIVNGGTLTQLSNFTRIRKRADVPLSKQDEWLKQNQLNELEIIRKREEDRKSQEKEQKDSEIKRPKEFYLDERSSVNSLGLSPDEKYMVFRVMKRAEGNRNTIIPNYVSSSGYTEEINGRTKVGNALISSESYIYDIQKDTIYNISIKELPGIKDLPDYVKDYPKQLEERTKKNEDRKVSINGPIWNLDGSHAVVIVSALDNKDRWIMKLDPATGKLSLLDRQRDEAWIGGPGIGGVYGGANAGWINDNTFYFQSEKSGYSHIYTVNVDSGNKKQITSGNYEIQSLQLSNDKKSFYFTANMEHPGITHFYRIPVQGGEALKLSSMKGGNEVSLSPDEKWLAIRYSYANKPWELFLQENKPRARAEQDH